MSFSALFIDAVAFVQNPTVWVYGSIPVICALIGWGTNWLAIHMTFYPLEFVGVGSRLGWQGVIPRNSKRIADKTVDLVTSRLIRPEEVLAKLDSQEIIRELEPVITDMANEIAMEVIAAENPKLWNRLPQRFKNELRSRFERGAPRLIEKVLEETRNNIDELFDLEDFIRSNLTGENTQTLNELFMRCGKEEFQFIVRSGLYLGFILGILQCGIWFLYPNPWVLPLLGIAVGYATNWIALKMIFRPIHPITVLGFTYQGLFLKRQNEVSKEYASLMANRIFSPAKVLERLVEGKNAEEFLRMVRKEIRSVFEPQGDIAKGIMVLLVGAESYRSLRAKAIGHVVDSLPVYSKQLGPYWEERVNIEETVSNRLASLPAEEFEEVLHSCFKEDEIILILVGAGLGMVAGLIQVLVLSGLN